MITQGVSVPEPRIVCVGSHLESEIALSELIDEGIPISGLVTLRRDAHEGVSDYVDLRPLCERSGIPVIDTADINDGETLARIRELRPHFIYVLGWNRLFGDELLTIPNGFVVGSHPTRLPEGRGRAPIPWTVLLEKRSSASTLFRITPGIDAGNILVQVPFDVPPRSYAALVYELSAYAMSRAFSTLTAQIRSGTVAEVEQDDRLATYYGRRTAEDGYLDFGESAENLERLVRAVSEPYPGAFAYYGDTKVEVWRAQLEDDRRHRGTQGQILAVEGNGVLVQATGGTVWLRELTSAGDMIPAETFTVGRRFGTRYDYEIRRLRADISDLRETPG